MYQVSSFLSLKPVPLYGEAPICLFIHPLEDIWLVSSMSLLKNKPAINVKIFVWTRCQFSWINRRGIARSSGKCPFDFLRNRPTAFQSDCTILHSDPSWRRVLMAPRPHWLEVLPVAADGRWHLTVALICISPVTSEVKHLLVGLLGRSHDTFMKCHFKSLAHFLLGCFIIEL